MYRTRVLDSACMGFETLKRRGTLPPTDELPEPWRSRTRQWSSYLFDKWKRERGPVPDWAKPILEGIAKRLGRTNSEDRKAWSHWMRAKKGGLHSQLQARRQGKDPAAKARHFLNFARAKRKREKEETEERAQFLQKQQKANEGYLEKVSALLSQGKAPFA
jgi:hypothetical protein